MGRMAWQERIAVAPDLHHGEPCIKGTRIPVAMIVGSLADGMTPSEIQAAYPQLSEQDIRAALSYAAELTLQDLLVPLPAWEALVRVKVDEDLPRAAAQSFPFLSTRHSRRDSAAAARRAGPPASP